MTAKFHSFQIKQIEKPMKKVEDPKLLYEISKALNESLDLKKSLYKVLDILSNSMDMSRGTVTITCTGQASVSLTSGRATTIRTVSRR